MKNKQFFQGKSFFKLSNSGVFRFLLIVLTLAATNIFATAQTNKLETEKGIIASIAPYNADVRQAILQTSQYPSVLTQLQESKTKTVASFQNLISNFGQKKQAWFYTLTRYPDLLHKLAVLPNGRKQDEVNSILPNQDPNLQLAAWKLYHGEKATLQQVDNMQIFAQQEFERSIQHLDGSTQAAFIKLSQFPEALSLLTDNIELTSSLGANYAASPTLINNQLLVLHDSLSVQNQREIAKYKKQLEDNPKAVQELNRATKAYARANGYNMPYQQGYYANNSNYYGNPYSYWFGYPSWYSSPFWYPGNFGFGGLGYYAGIGGYGGYGLYGFPSYGFSNWFFNSGYYNRYPNLYRQFGNYYNGHHEGNRFYGSANNGFIGAANNHFSPSGNRQMNYQNSPSAFSRSNGQSLQQGFNQNRANTNMYRPQSGGSFGGNNGFRSSGFSGGGFQGGGFHSGGFQGGGFHGGGGRH